MKNPMASVFSGSSTYSLGPIARSRYEELIEGKVDGADRVSGEVADQQSRRQEHHDETEGAHGKGDDARHDQEQDRSTPRDSSMRICPNERSALSSSSRAMPLRPISIKPITSGAISRTSTSTRTSPIRLACPATCSQYSAWIDHRETDENAGEQGRPDALNARLPHRSHEFGADRTAPGDRAQNRDEDSEGEAGGERQPAESLQRRPTDRREQASKPGERLR